MDFAYQFVLALCYYSNLSNISSTANRNIEFYLLKVQFTESLPYQPCFLISPRQYWERPSGKAENTQPEAAIRRPYNHLRFPTTAPKVDFHNVYSYMCLPSETNIVKVFVILRMTKNDKKVNLFSVLWRDISARHTNFMTWEPFSFLYETHRGKKSIEKKR